MTIHRLKTQGGRQTECELTLAARVKTTGVQWADGDGDASRCPDCWLEEFDVFIHEKTAGKTQEVRVGRAVERAERDGSIVVFFDTPALSPLVLRLKGGA